MQRFSVVTKNGVHRLYLNKVRIFQSTRMIEILDTIKLLASWGVR